MWQPSERFVSPGTMSLCRASTRTGVPPDSIWLERSRLDAKGVKNVDLGRAALSRVNEIAFAAAWTEA